MMTKRKGRVAGGDETATRMLTMRLRPSDYETLRGKAEANGRSISAQAEVRLLDVEPHEIGRLVTQALQAVEQRTGKSWRTDDLTRFQCRVALDAIGTGLLGPMPDLNALLADIKAEHAATQIMAEQHSKPGANQLLEGAKLASRLSAVDRRMDELGQMLAARTDAIAAMNEEGVT